MGLVVICLWFCLFGSSSVKAQQPKLDADESGAYKPIRTSWKKRPSPLNRKPDSLRIWLLRERFMQALATHQNKEQCAITIQPSTPVMHDLHEACMNGDEKTFNELIKNKQLVNKPDVTGGMPLHYVVGSPFLVKPSASSSDEEKVRYEKECELRCKMIRALFRAGANLESRDTSGNTPMDYAKQSGHDVLIACLQTLLSFKGLLD